MQDAHAAFRTFLIGANELLECSLKPRRHHDSFLVPHGAETFPVPGVAPDGPGFDDFLDCQRVESPLVHRIGSDFELRFVKGAAPKPRVRIRARTLTGYESQISIHAPQAVAYVVRNR